MMLDLEITETDIPDDLPVTQSDATAEEVPGDITPGGDYDPDYPGSTPEAPYGYKADGTPYKRRPGKRGSSGSRIIAPESQARAAAAMLAKVNSLIAISLHVSGLPQTASAVNDGNREFETLAYEALRTDPVLCRKILSAGGTSGRAGLYMAYGSLAITAGPTAWNEYKERKRK